MPETSDIPIRTIGIVTPAPRGSTKGNRITALRWARMLRALGERVFVEQEWSGRACDALIALHAGKSAGSVERFQRAHPGRPVVVVLTGTDVSGDRDEWEPAVRATLARADRLVVLQPSTRSALPAELRAKTRVIRQSASAPPHAVERSEDAFEVSVIGHLRAVKDPLRAARAARLLHPSSRLCLLHAGGALDEDLARAARVEMEENPRYRWLGELPHARSVELLARSRLHVLTSLSEGGANVVSEAIACGVPVLSSRIEGSVGILGEAYPGYFTAGDERELARLLERCERDPCFLGNLRAWCDRLRPLVAREREQRALGQLLEELVPARARASAPG